MNATGWKHEENGTGKRLLTVRRGKQGGVRKGRGRGREGEEEGEEDEVEVGAAWQMDPTNGTRVTFAF